MKKKMPWFVKFWHDHNEIWLCLLFWTEIGLVIYRIIKEDCLTAVVRELLLFPLTLFTISISYCLIDAIIHVKYYPNEPI